MTFTCEQRSAEWLALRVGKVTASRIADVLATIKKGEAASRKNYRTEIVVESLTGRPVEQYVSKEMEWGIATEQFALAAYELHTDTMVGSIGFAVHPQIARFGASPDGGLIGDDGLVEIKCPNTSTHLEYILAGEVPAEYQPQMLAQMACTGRSWCEFVSFDPRLPAHLQLFVRRFQIDEKRIKEILIAVEQFLSEVDETLLKLGAAAPQVSLEQQLRASVEAVQTRKGPQPVVAVMDKPQAMEAF